MANAASLVGERYGKLIVVARAENNEKGNTMWACICDCGNHKIALGYDLTHNRTTSCGCGRGRHENHKDLVGEKYGMLSPIRVVGKKNSHIMWECRCDCGKLTIVTANNLRNGHTRSCGCIRPTKKEKPLSHRFDDGKYYTEILGKEQYDHLRRAWSSMIQRCKPYYHCHSSYYDRGIGVCDEWKIFRNFAEWAINNGHDITLSLDRKDNDKGYSPDNCRWVTMKEQQNNKRTNVYVDFMGRTQTLKQWCEELGLPYGTIRARHRNGWETPRLFSAVG